jgi:hypothetical protein
MDRDGALAISNVAPDGVLPALLVSGAPEAAPRTSPTPAASEPASVQATPGAITGHAAASSPSLAAPTDPLLYRQDPRFLAPELSDLPDGGRLAWTLVGDDTTHLLEYRYSITFGRHPNNGAAAPLDPLLLITIQAADSMEHALTAWADMYANSAPGERPGSPIGRFADDQFYALAPSLIDVRARYKNIIFQVFEVTSTRSISLDDTVALVRIMINRVGYILH